MSKIKVKVNWEKWIDYEYEEDVVYECPVRGTVTQTVMIKRLKTRLIEDKPIIKVDDEITLEPYSDDIKYTSG